MVKELSQSLENKSTVKGELDSTDDPRKFKDIEMGTYNKLSKEQLLEHALTMGIPNPETYQIEPLRLKVLRAHTIQQLYEGLNGNLSIESQVHEVDEPWRLAVSLREIGVTEETLAKLISNGVRSSDQIKLLNKEILGNAGIPIIQAALIVNTYGVNENLIDLNRSLAESEGSKTKTVNCEARKRCLMMRWPNEKNIEKAMPFHEFLQTLEYDLKMADPSRSEWVDFLRGSLVGSSRKIAEDIIGEKPGIRYVELKTKLVNQISNNLQKSEKQSGRVSRNFVLPGNLSVYSVQ